MIYYVEDDTNIRELAIYTLRQAGFDAAGFAGSEEFFEACKAHVPDVILLDIMLSGKDGIDILGEIRQDPSLCHVPVMMLSAKGSEIDKVVGLDAGADDYLAKPFGMMELVSRVKALIRRAQAPARISAAKLQCGAITLDPDSREAAVDRTPIPLTLKEFDLLQMLMQNRGHVLSRSQLLKHVWDWEYAGSTRTVDVHVQTLRQKIAEVSPSAASLIETVRGIGYMIRD